MYVQNFLKGGDIVARPKKAGLDYFPLDVNVSDDDKIFYLEAEYGVEGFGIFIKLLLKIYDEGYYIEWDDFNIKVTSRKVNVDINTLREVVNVCLESGLFNKKLYEKYNILTSKGIQERYLEATIRRKSVKIIKEYSLIDVNDYENIQSIELSGVNVNINYKSGVVNEEKSTQRKGKESIVDNSTGNIYTDDFEKFWNHYPRKEGKEGAFKHFKKVSKDCSVKELIKSAKNYAKANKGTERKFIKKGYNFFNDGLYKDYINYEHVETKKYNGPNGVKPPDLSNLGKREEPW